MPGMRCHEKPLGPLEVEPWFCGDGIKGEYWVECDNCKQFQESSPNCIECGRYFVYRPWWSW